MEGRGKEKVISVLLAVFLGFWTWLYTYRRDHRKFWVGLGLSIVFTIPCPLLLGLGLLRGLGGPMFSPNWAALIVLIALVVSTLGTGCIWLWAIIDTALKKQEWYEQY